MRLEAWFSQQAHIEVDQDAVVTRLIGVIRDKYKLRNVDSIKNGRMIENVEYATSHSWTKQEDRGVPTPEQKQAIQVIDFLKYKLK